MAAALGLLAAAAPALRERIAAGNDLFAAGSFEEALQVYEAALREHPGAAPAELLHNLAAAQFKLGRIEEARELWVRAAALKDAAFEAQARYNLGNCNYADALQAAAEGDLSGTLERLGRAREHYRDALQLDPGLTDARANLELAHQLIRELREQAEQSEQPSSQGDDSQEHDDSRQDQKSEGESSSDGSGEGETSASEPSDNDAGSQASTQPAQTQPSETQPASEAPPEQGSDEPEQHAPPPTDPAATQPADTQPTPQPETESAQEEQPPPPPAPEQEHAAGDQPTASNVQLTAEEAERLLQMIRDAEMKRRQAALRQQRLQQRPVERDW